MRNSNMDHSTRNILNNYKKLLGQYCEVNQFIELTKRCFHSDHRDAMESEKFFKPLAEKYQLTLTSYDNKPGDVIIAKAYIINLHACFEEFLKRLAKSIQKYGNKVVAEKSQEDSYLKYIVKVLFGGEKKLSLNEKNLFYLCEYYRLVRNASVHILNNDDSESRELQAQFNKIKDATFRTETKFKELSAPNPHDKISYDDFVLFSQSTVELAMYFFENIKYNYVKIIEDVPTDICNGWKSYLPERCKKAIRSYIETNFKVDETLHSQLDSLCNIIMAQ